MKFIEWPPTPFIGQEYTPFKISVGVPVVFDNSIDTFELSYYLDIIVDTRPYI
jgi:hypothetical protein